MTATSRYLLVSGWLLLGVANGVGQPKPRLDAFGDPLPEYAIARLGSLRFRSVEHFGSTAMSPDGKCYALVGRRWISLYDATNGRLLRTIHLAHGTSRLWFSADGKTLAGAKARFAPGGDASTPPNMFVQLWEVATGSALGEIAVGVERIETIVVFGKRVAVVTGERGTALNLEILDRVTGRKLARVPLLHDCNVRVAVSNDGEQLATWGENLRGGKLTQTEEQARNNSIQLWHTTTGKETRHLLLEGLPRHRKPVAVSPDGNSIAYSADDAELRVREVATGNERKLADTQLSSDACLVYSADGKSLAGFTKEGVARWNATTGELLGLHKPSVLQRPTLLFTSEGRLLAWERHPSLVQVTDVVAGKSLTPQGGHLTEVVALAFPGDNDLRSLCRDGVLCRWRPADATELTRVLIQAKGRQERLERVYCGAAWFSPDAKQVVLHNHGKLFGVEGDSGRLLWQVNKDFRNAVFAADGSRLAVTHGSARATPRVHLHRLDVDKRAPLPEEFPKDDSAPVGNVVAFSPDGKRLVTETYQSGKEPTAFAKLWDVATKKELWRIEDGWTAAFSPDGTALAVVGLLQETKLSLCDVHTGKRLRPFEVGREVRLRAVTFAPDGRTVAASAYGQDDKSILLVWETATGSVRLETSGEFGFANALAYSPDGSRLASGGTDTTVLVWDLAGRVAQQGKPPPSATELDEAWTTLSAPDGRRAFRAMSRLIAAPAECVALSQRHLQPVAAADGAAVARLIAALEQRRFADREAAFGELAALGASVEPALKKALAANPTLELRKRLEALLQHIHSRTLPPEELRRVRAVEVLERIGTAEAQRLLQKLAAGNPVARLSREATAALERLKRAGP